MRRLQNLTLAAVGAILLMSTASAQASTIIDLTSGGSGSSNGALYEWTGTQPTGTGVIYSFLGVQARGTEQGYNHSLGHNVPWDTKPGGHTNDIQMSDLVVANVSGVDYFQFLLDINESSGHDNEFLSLDNVRIWTRNGPISSADENFDHLGTLRFHNDVGPNGDTTVWLDYSLNGGSGSGDMFLYVPVSLFAGTMPDDYVYFYSLFGNAFASDAGFEEWGLLRANGPGGGGGPENPPVVPEPGTMLLMGSGLLIAMRKLRQRGVPPTD